MPPEPICEREPQLSEHLSLQGWQEHGKLQSRELFSLQPLSVKHTFRSRREITGRNSSALKHDTMIYRQAGSSCCYP